MIKKAANRIDAISKIRFAGTVIQTRARARTVGLFNVVGWSSGVAAFLYSVLHCCVISDLDRDSCLRQCKSNNGGSPQMMTMMMARANYFSPFSLSLTLKLSSVKACRAAAIAAIDAAKKYRFQDSPMETKVPLFCLSRSLYVYVCGSLSLFIPCSTVSAKGAHHLYYDRIAHSRNRETMTAYGKFIGRSSPMASAVDALPIAQEVRRMQRPDEVTSFA
ncbi:hypothetical protein D918_08541 [Trichuris suis]|nr:hypothetical protein D918_08541 [Trichuris suis]